MKIRSNTLYALVITVVVFAPQLNGCKKNSSSSLPVVTTAPIQDITPTSASGGGNLVSLGSPSGAGDYCGIQVSTTADFAQGNIVMIIRNNSFKVGSYLIEFNGLKTGTQYFVRAFATNKAGTAYGSIVSFSTTKLVVGQHLNGGIIFFIDSTGQHGFIAAPYDQGNVRWFNGEYVATGATSLTDGYTNTFYAWQQGDGDYAASLCGSYLDTSFVFNWYLPSKYELNLMYMQKDVLPGLSNKPYWSSTESSDSLAWTQDFSNGNKSEQDKAIAYPVRAISFFFF